MQVQNEELIDLKNINEDLKLRGGLLSPLQFDKLNSELNLAKTELT